jgi:hypothetical protein
MPGDSGGGLCRVTRIPRRVTGALPSNSGRLEDLKPRTAVRGFLPDALVRRPFRREPDFGVTSVNCDFGELVARAEEPA